MKESENGKIQNGKEILDQIKKIKHDYAAEDVDVAEEELSFLDRLNKLIQLILNDGSLSIYTALTPESLERWRKSKFKRSIKRLFVNNFRNFLYFCLLATITGFLVSEALDFYAIGEIITTKTYVKAILTEVCFIFLSGYRSSNILETFFVTILRGCVFSLMLFVITSQTFMTGTKTVENTKAIQQQILLIEKQISNKEQEIEYYRKKDWPITMKQLIKEKEKLTDKLIILKEKQAQGASEKVSDLVRYKTYGKAFFRVILLFISILVTRRIFKF